LEWSQNSNFEVADGRFYQNQFSHERTSVRWSIPWLNKFIYKIYLVMIYTTMLVLQNSIEMQNNNGCLSRVIFLISCRSYWFWGYHAKFVATVERANLKSLTVKVSHRDQRAHVTLINYKQCCENRFSCLHHTRCLSLVIMCRVAKRRC